MCVVKIYKVGWVFLLECSCGLVSRYTFGQRQVSCYMAAQHVENRESSDTREAIWTHDVTLAQQIDAKCQSLETPRLQFVVKSADLIEVQTRKGVIQQTLMSLAKGGQ